MLSLNIIVQAGLEFKIEDFVSPSDIIFSRVRRGHDRHFTFHAVNTDESTELLLTLKLGKENVWKR